MGPREPGRTAATPPANPRELRFAELPALPQGALVGRADEIFARTSPYSGDGLRNHCLRMFYFSSLLMDARGISMPRELLYLIAMVHDLGLVSELDAGANYLERSLQLVRRELDAGEFSVFHGRVISECLLYNHRMRPVPIMTPQAEAFRCAVQIEHSFGLLRHELPRAPVRAVFDRYPRDTFDRVLVDFIRRVMMREPWTVVRGIFW